MGLNDIELTGPVVAELFKANLLRVASNQPIQKPVANSGPAEYILIYDVPAARLETVINSFIKPFMAACNMPADKALLLNKAEDKLPGFEKIMANKPRLILFFNIEPDSLGFPMRFPLHRQQPYDGAVLFTTHGAEEISTQTVLKKEFWSNLKTFFV